MPTETIWVGKAPPKPVIPLKVRVYRDFEGAFKTLEWRGGAEPHVVGGATWYSPWMEVTE